MPDFIEVYPDVLDATVCRGIIDRFEASGQASRGRTGSGVDTSLKDSSDITITGRPDWQDVENLLQRAAFSKLKEYIRQYRFALIGPLALRYQTAAGKVELVNNATFDSVPEPQFDAMLRAVFRSGSINLQKYQADRGGYPHWHSEIYPLDAQAETLHRVLLYTFYLNDVPKGGETEFHYQQRLIRPRIGSLLIAPAGFTHTHRGNIPSGGDKYIATSWVLFSRAESLYSKT